MTVIKLTDLMRKQSEYVSEYLNDGYFIVREKGCDSSENLIHLTRNNVDYVSLFIVYDDDFDSYPSDPMPSYSLMRSEWRLTDDIGFIASAYRDHYYENGEYVSVDPETLHRYYVIRKERSFDKTVLADYCTCKAAKNKHRARVAARTISRTETGMEVPEGLINALRKRTGWKRAHSGNVTMRVSVKRDPMSRSGFMRTYVIAFVNGRSKRRVMIRFYQNEHAIVTEL